MQSYKWNTECKRAVEDLEKTKINTNNDISRIRTCALKEEEIVRIHINVKVRISRCNHLAMMPNESLILKNISS
jgi:hypothetical protein